MGRFESVGRKCAVSEWFRDSTEVVREVPALRRATPEEKPYSGLQVKPEWFWHSLCAVQLCYATNCVRDFVTVEFIGPTGRNRRGHFATQWQTLQNTRISRSWMASCRGK
eukprot:jgi/Botrbrau1/8606/Bobra.0196s0006.1